MTTSTEKRSLVLMLPCTYEIHDRREFQAAGHFVQGGVKSTHVHCLTLTLPRGEPDSPLTKEVQVLRVQGQSWEEARAMMVDAIKQHLVANAVTKSSQGIDYDNYLKMHTEWGHLSQYLRRNYLWEIQQGRHLQFDGPIQTAIHYLAKERRRWIVRLLSLFRKPHAEFDIDPERIGADNQ